MWRRRRFNRRRFVAPTRAFWALGVVWAFGAGSASAGAGPAGDAARGEALLKALPCQECHGDQGQGTAEHYPKLAGQSSAYLAKQLTDFHDGARKNELMAPMAADLSAQHIADLAAFFASRPPWTGRLAPRDSVGQNLFAEGAPERGLPACAGCHGEAAAGDAAASDPAPALAGQNQSYLAHQLEAFKVDERRNSAGDVMNDVAHRLTAQEIDHLAQFLASLSGRDENAN